MDFELGSGTRVDTARLIDTRLLLQANSGGGKSWALRRLLEQTHGQVQQIVIDPEGEFATLREKFDYVLAARNDGDTAANPRSAKLLAERLLELGVSAILDLYELKKPDRVQFVKHFLETLVDAPKKLWHPALIVVDEVHDFCPQQGEAESGPAVIDLGARGRKRGFCAVLATQRLSKLHKDAAAELNNKLIGRTGLDVDVKRAADELGFGKERWRELREQPEGHFFGFGPAISREVRAVHVGPVFTTHPKAGARLTTAPPAPSAKVRAVLSQLADLPAEVEKREKTVADLQAEVTRLTRTVAELRSMGAPAPEPVEVEVVKPETVAILERALAIGEKVFEQMTAAARGWSDGTATLRGDLVAVTAARARAPIPVRDAAALDRWTEAVRPGPIMQATRRLDHERAPVATGPGENIGKGERAILTALVQHPEGRTKVQLALLTGYTHGGGRFNNLLGSMRSRGWIFDRGSNLAITPEGQRVLGPWEPLPRGRALRERWAHELGASEGKVLETLATHFPRGLHREALATATDYNIGGRFNNILGRLRTLELITRGQEIKLAEELAG